MNKSKSNRKVSKDLRSRKVKDKALRTFCFYRNLKANKTFCTLRLIFLNTDFEIVLLKSKIEFRQIECCSCKVNLTN